MQKAMLLAIILAIGFSPMFANAAGMNFSGGWILSERIPSFGSKTPNVLLVIKQAGNNFYVTRSMIDDERIIESHYTLDGTENINTEPNEAGLVTIRSTSKWNNGALVLEGLSIFAGPDKDVTTKWKTEYVLSDDGAVLTVIETHPTPFGEAVTSQIFIRR
jgi:hypothetical protein